MRLPVYAQLAGRLIELGWSPIPCSGKVPTASGWSAWCDRQPMPALVDSWVRHQPDANVGLALSQRVAVVDIDRDPDGEVMAKALRMLGDTPLKRVGQPGRIGLFYRLAEPMPPLKRPWGELLTKGRQVIGFGIHPDTRQPYRWLDDDPTMVGPDDLPLVTRAQMEAFCGPETAGDAGPHVDTGLPAEATPEAVEGALKAIPIADKVLTAQEWIAIGYAVKHGLGDRGRQLWCDWSLLYPGCTNIECMRTWRAIKPDGSITIGTLFDRALQHGWSPEPELRFHPEDDAAIEHGAGIAAALMNGHAYALVEPVPEPVSAPEIPGNSTDIDAIVADAPGLLGDIVRWMVATAYKPQPWLSLGAALTAVGTAMGRKYRLTSPDVRSNLYVVALAPSGGGKEHPQVCIDRLFVAAGLGDLISMDMRSEAGVFASIWRNATKLLLVDEVGHLMKVAMNERVIAPHLRAIMTLLMKLWSRNKGRMNSGELADMRDLKKQRLEVDQPSLSLYGSTVAEPFWQAMQEGSVSDGSLARFLIFQAAGDVPGRQYGDIEPMERRQQELAADLLRIFVGGGEPTQLAVASSMGRHRPPTQESNPPPPALVDVPLDPACLPVIEALRLRQEVEQATLGERDGRSVVVRRLEQTMRVALIAAVADNPLGTIVYTQHVEWAASLTRACIDDMLSGIARHVAGSEREAKLKKVLGIIRAHGDWIDSNSLVRKTQFLDRRTRAEFLNDLVDEGSLEAMRKPSATKPTTLYRAAKGKPHA